ncbi:MAG: hypothetical protein RL537_173 [Actinomycetota bacterium]|jgi:hypothetical protein
MNQADSSLVVPALLAVAGFLVYLVFFTGDGYKGILEDLKSLSNKKKERFPLPVFDRSKIELPRPKKPKIQDPVREPINFNEQQLRDWAEQLQQSIKEIRKEASELAKAYNAMPPSLIEDPSKLKRKPAVKKTTKKVGAKKTAKKPVTKKTSATKPKKKPAARKKGR